MRFKRFLSCLGVLAFILSLPRVAAKQLAGHPAADWSKTLEADNRVSTLKIGEIVAKLRLKPGETIADIGAGPGLFEVQLAKAVSPYGKVYAEDIDAGFFPEIKKKAMEAHVNNVETVLGQYTDPNLPAKNLDVVFFHDVLHHIQDRAGYLKTVTRYLKGSGRVVVIDFEAGQNPHKDQPDLQVSRQQLAMWAKDAGLKQVEDVKMFPDKYFLVYSK
jgi:ubiquinone/menaquinone biosynthesis C-methylase UbiE